MALQVRAGALNQVVVSQNSQLGRPLFFTARHVISNDNAIGAAGDVNVTRGTQMGWSKFTLSGVLAIE
jgi:hypothetical protein